MNECFNKLILPAAYHLRFYELDQAITVGMRDHFQFFLDPHFSEQKELDFIPLGMLLVFNNTLDGSARNLTLDCTVRKIHHLEIGAINSIDTNGLSYRIYSDAGILQVDAEVNVGQIEEGFIQPKGWLFTVELEVHSFISLS